MRNKLLLLLLLTSVFVQGQDKGQSELGSWYMYFGMNRVSDKLSIHSELQGRFYEPATNFNQLLLRLGLNYHISENAMLTAGYGYIPTESFLKGSNLISSTEHRIWQQFILKNKVGRVYFEHRYRLEQRFIDNHQVGDQYKNRGRYRLMISIPLTSPTMDDKTFYLGIYDELFMHMEANPYDQNRLYFALGYKLSKVWNFQAGYLRHNIKNLDYNRLQFALFLNPDFRKKQ